MDDLQRRRICHLIEAVMTADGVLAPSERAFLLRIVGRFNVEYGVAEAGPIGPVSDPGRAARLLRLLEPKVQANVMALLIDAAICDGEVSPSEHALLMVAAAALGIDAADVETRVQQRLAAR